MGFGVKRAVRLLLKAFLIFLLLLLVLAGLFFYKIRIDLPEVNSKLENAKREELSSSVYQFGKSFARKNKHEIWEVFLEGAPYERGLAYGKLLAEPIERQEDHFVSQVEKLVPSEWWRNTLKYLVAYFNSDLPKHIPQEYQQEIYGVSKSFSDKYNNIGPKYYRILNYHAAHDIGHALQEYSLVGCTSFAIKMGYTEDSSLLIGRNFDFYLGDEFAEEKVFTVFRPDSGYQFATYSWAGFMGVVSGMNEKGLSLTINAAKSDLPTGAKTPISIVAREILQYAQNIQEALAIAEKREVFVSESILIGSAQDKKAAIIEKSPNKMGLFVKSEDVLVCANHYQSEAFKLDSNNIKNITSSDSYHRYKRVNNLIQQEQPLNPQKAVTILRDILDTNSRFIGFGNPKSINQLIAHHSVVFQVEQLKMWVSTSPYQMGEFLCYDLKKIFAQKHLSVKENWNDSVQNIAASPFIIHPDFQQFQKTFKPTKKILYDAYQLGIPYDLKFDEANAFINSNPQSYITYLTIGEYYLSIGKKDKAKLYFTQALGKSVASKEEELKIKELIKSCVHD